MEKEYYLGKIKRIPRKSRKIVKECIDNFYEFKEVKINKHNYSVGDLVYLKKGTLLHGTYKNIDGLREIVKEGLISNSFIEGRESKYIGCTNVWNLNSDYELSDYIDFYSGVTVLYQGLFVGGIDTRKDKIDIIKYSDMDDLFNIIKNNSCHKYTIEETKESRFMPNLTYDIVNIGIIFNNNVYIDKLKEKDILSLNISDKEVKPFINKRYYNRFIKDRKNKDEFFTDRESSIIFGIPSNFIEGILVGRTYEKDNSILDEIKEILPDAYICNLDGKVIRI